jgi:hypothetical protein
VKGKVARIVFKGRWDEQSIISWFLFEHHILNLQVQPQTKSIITFVRYFVTGNQVRFVRDCSEDEFPYSQQGVQVEVDSEPAAAADSGEFVPAGKWNS